jgi:RimJ/RimL family protein N-acetyltransferase
MEESMVCIEELNVDNWLKVCDLEVSARQKEIFPIPNVYWIGISRYEEHTTLFAIKNGDEYVGLIGCGFDEDGASGYINPLMIDAKHQGKGYSKAALQLIINYLKDKLHVSVIHLGHRKNNVHASKLYDSFGFKIIGEDGQDYYRELIV